METKMADTKLKESYRKKDDGFKAEGKLLKEK